MDTAEAQLVSGVDLVQFSCSMGHKCELKAIVRSSSHHHGQLSRGIWKTKAIHKELSKGAFSKMMPDPDAQEEEYDNIQNLTKDQILAEV